VTNDERKENFKMTKTNNPEIKKTDPGEHDTQLLEELISLQKKYQKLEEEDRLCNLCLEKEIAEGDSLFCPTC